MFTIPKGTDITAEIIKAAIAYNEETLSPLLSLDPTTLYPLHLSFRNRYDKLERYYLGNHDIVERIKVSSLKNNKVVVNHAKYITDINVGYLLGNPVEYQVDEGDIDVLLDEYKKQSIADLDHEIAKDVSIFGCQYEYVYVNEANEVKSKDIDVRNCVLIYDDTIEHNKVAGVIYTLGDNSETYEQVMLVTNTLLTDYASKGKLRKGEETPHYFGAVPIVEYTNNSEETGDFETVIPLIDAYNLLQSDRINDKEQLVDAILALYGFDMTEDLIKSLKANRVLSNLPTDGKAEYLVKSLSESDTDVLRAVIEQDIHKISMTPNLSDENFVGNASGVAIRYKLLAFEQSVSNKERYFTTGLLERFALYNAFLAKANKMSLIPAYTVDVVFKRNLPQNDYETSQMLVNLEPFIDRETLVGQLSFIKDASEVIEKHDEENEQQTQQQVGEFGTPQETVAKVESKVNTEVQGKEKSFMEKLASLLR